MNYLSGFSKSKIHLKFWMILLFTTLQEAHDRINKICKLGWGYVLRFMIEVINVVHFQGQIVSFRFFLLVVIYQLSLVLWDTIYSERSTNTVVTEVHRIVKNTWCIYFSIERMYIDFLVSYAQISKEVIMKDFAFPRQLK